MNDAEFRRLINDIDIDLPEELLPDHETGGVAPEADPDRKYDPGFKYFSPELQDMTVRLHAALEAGDKEGLRATKNEIVAYSQQRLFDLAKDFDREDALLSDWFDRHFEDVSIIVTAFVTGNPLMGMLIEPFIADFKECIRAVAVYGYMKGKNDVYPEAGA